MDYQSDKFPVWSTIMLFLSATVSMILFALFAKTTLLLMSSIQYVSVLATILFFGLSELLSHTPLVEYDVVYNGTLMWNHLAGLVAAAASIPLVHHLGNDAWILRLCVFWFIASFVKTIQQCVLFYLTSISIWRAYLPRIKTTVVAHEIVCGLSDFVLKYAPSPQEVLRRSAHTKNTIGHKKSSIFDVESGERILNQRSESSLKREEQFMGRGAIPLHSVHAALRMHNLEDMKDPVAIQCLFDRIVAALRYGSFNNIPQPHVMRALKIPQVIQPLLGDHDNRSTLDANPNMKSIITKQHIYRIFSNNKPLADAAMSLLDRNNDGAIDRLEFLSAFGNINVRRDDLERTIADYEAMVAVLDRALSFVTTILLFFVALLLLKVNILANSVLMISLFAATSIAFGSTLQGLFEGIIFAFSLRPFDCGDRIFVRDESLAEQNYVVSKITLMTTTLTRVDGIVVTVLNSKLKAANVVNAYRAETAVHKFFFKLPVDANLDILPKLKSAVEMIPDLECIERADVLMLGVREDGLSTNGLVIVIQNCNFQDHDLRARNQTKIAIAMHEFFRTNKVPHVSAVLSM